jgi:hypothetical protein
MSPDEVLARLLAARDVHARLVALRDRAGTAARTLDGPEDGPLPDLPAEELGGVVLQLDNVVGKLEQLCGRSGAGADPPDHA